MSLMTLEPCISLSFDGQCEAAFKFYERCLNGKITFILTWGDLPAAEDVPTEWRSKVADAAMVVGNTRLQGSYESDPGNVPSLDSGEYNGFERSRGFYRRRRLMCWM